MHESGPRIEELRSALERELASGLEVNGEPRLVLELMAIEVEDADPVKVRVFLTANGVRYGFHAWLEKSAFMEEDVGERADSVRGTLAAVVRAKGLPPADTGKTVTWL